MPHTLLIGGKPSAGRTGKTFALVEPSTGEPWAEVSEAGVDDLDEALEVATRAFEEGPWPRTSASARGRVLARAATLVRERLEDFATAEARNAGKPIADARGEVEAAAACLEYYSGAATKFFGEVVPVQGPGLGRGPERAGRGGRPDRALELPSIDRDLEGGAGPGLRQPGGPQTRLLHPADGADAGRAAG